jgi:methionyl-tRNA synthetase
MAYNKDLGGGLGNLLNRSLKMANNYRAGVVKIGGFDTSIAFYGEDTNIARRLHAAGKVKFSQRFRIFTSARRLESEGLFKIATVYAANFFSEAILHKPVTKEYIDIR